jgi:radical SAM/Cys-rich protein
LAGKAYEDLPEFFAKHQVQVVSSLPYYEKQNTDRQRGLGVFDKSIRALQLLNQVGYGRPGSGLQLDLVYNPGGAFLPASEKALESDFKRELKKLFDIEFNRLFAITNLPVSRFLDYLIESGNLDQYMEKLVNAFNPSAAQGVMCRSLISVSWDGFIYDCDFNQMLEIPVTASAPQHIRDFTAAGLSRREIQVNQHCFGCTAGQGSSCGGQVA